MTVINLSLIGVHFYMHLPHILHVDNVIEMAFSLDDPHHTELCHRVIIRWVEGQQVGVEFCDLQAYEHKLLFYLRSA
jgi:hypothetical protein